MTDFLHRHILTALLLLASISLHAARDAVFIWTTANKYECYRLESLPVVTYSNGNVLFTLAGKKKPELTLPLPANAKVKMVFGVYGMPVNINRTESQPDTIMQNGKYISGGRLIIVKNRKLYLPNGKRLK